ncbi:MAG: hypothetical protein ACJ8BW_20420 [Ktedonobacteraceae bacterium]
MMHELDIRKDQFLTMCNVALAILETGIRGRFLLSGYAYATWCCLQSFFSLPGRV